VVVAGLAAVDDQRLAAALEVPVEKLRRADPGVDLGYAAGMTGVQLLLEAAEPGTALLVSAGGIGLENTFATTLEIR